MRLSKLRQEIYDAQTKLQWEEIVGAAQHLTDVIRNQQCKQQDLVNALSQLHLECKRGRERLTLFLAKQQTSQLQ